MAIIDIKKTAETKMTQSIEAFKNSLTKIRTGRANPALLDSVQVDYYGSPVPLSQVANLTLIDSRTIGIQPWEKGMGAKIEKAMRSAEKLKEKQLTADAEDIERDARTADPEGPPADD